MVDFKPYLNFTAEGGLSKYHIRIEGGDNKYAAIAAASILAKVERDRYISEICEKDPTLEERYDLLKNKGYNKKTHGWNKNIWYFKASQNVWYMQRIFLKLNKNIENNICNIMASLSISKDNYIMGYFYLWRKKERMVLFYKPICHTQYNRKPY